jgi:class 3 adenylate cyclase
MLPETRYAEGPEGLVAFQTFGRGSIDLLVSTPWAWNIEIMWEQPLVERFFNRLATFSRVIVYDKRGTGLSDPVPLGAMPTIEEWTDDIGVVLDAAGSERAALLSLNESSFMGILFAASHPERATALVIVDGAASVARKEDYPAGLPEHFVEKAADYFRARDYAETLAPSHIADDGFVAWMKRLYRFGTAPSAREKIFRNSYVWDVRAVLDTVRVPTLVIHRAEERYYLVGHGRYLAEHIDGARYVELPGADHHFYAGDQEAILGEIQAFLTGVRGDPDFDRVLATVLFTDIVSSTDRAAELGDRRWRTLLDAHDRLIEAHISQYRGRRIKTTGDGVLATFDGPARAIRCALALADEIGQRLGVEIRAGLHTGEIELRDHDIGGIAVALAARVMAEAGPGQVLVSGAVPPLVAGSGLEFDDLGSRVLKGVPGEWRLHAVKP